MQAQDPRPTFFFRDADDTPKEIGDKLTSTTIQPPGYTIIHRQVSPSGTLLLDGISASQFFTTINAATADWTAPAATYLRLHVTPKDGGWSEPLSFPLTGDGAATRVQFVGHGENAIPAGLDANGNIPDPILSGRVFFTRRIMLRNDSAIWNIAVRIWTGSAATPIAIYGDNNYVGFTNCSSENTYPTSMIYMDAAAGRGCLVEGSVLKLASVVDGAMGYVVGRNRQSVPGQKPFLRDCVIQAIPLVSGNETYTIEATDIGGLECGNATDHGGNTIVLVEPSPDPVNPKVKSLYIGTPPRSPSVDPKYITFFQYNAVKRNGVLMSSLDEFLTTVTVAPAADPPAGVAAKSDAGAKANPYDDFLKILLSPAPWPSINQGPPTGVMRGIWGLYRN